MEYVLVLIAVIDGQPEVYTPPTTGFLTENQCELIGASLVNALEQAKYLCVVPPR